MPSLGKLLGTMRRILFCATLGVLAVAAWGSQGTTPPKKKAPAKAGPSSPAVHSAAATSRKPAVSSRPAASKTNPATRTTASRGTRNVPAPLTTWKNRQMAPDPGRYKEIQDALVAKGYLKSEDANGSWSPASTDALKKFQGEQNLDSSGKINSLSLIALGLGPRHDAAVVKPPALPQPAQELPASGR